MVVVGGGQAAAAPENVRAFPSGLYAEKGREVVPHLCQQVLRGQNVRQRLVTELPDPGERVIVTDGVFVGEAYLSKGGIWLRYGMEMVDRRTGIFPPVAWMPLPVFLKP